MKLAPIAAACLTLLSGFTAAQDAPGGSGAAQVWNCATWPTAATTLAIIDRE